MTALRLFPLCHLEISLTLPWIPALRFFTRRESNGSSGSGAQRTTTTNSDDKRFGVAEQACPERQSVLPSLDERLLAFEGLDRAAPLPSQPTGHYPVPTLATALTSRSQRAKVSP